MVATEARVRKAKNTAMIFGAVALVCAAGAAVLISRLLDAKGYMEEKKVKVVVAREAIAAGDTLTAEAVRVVTWPESTVPPGTFSDPKELFKEGTPAPVSSTGMLPGEPIMSQRLAGASQGTAMAALVRPGFRAVSVKIDDSVARAGLLYPGAHVDVIGTLADPNGRKTTTHVIVENVRVLSVESQTDVELYKHRLAQATDKSKPTTNDAVVTIEVSAEQSELVFLSSRNGKADLALRNASDDEAPVTKGADYNSFLGMGSPPATPPAAGAQPPRAAQVPPRTGGLSAAEIKRTLERDRAALHAGAAPPTTNTAAAAPVGIETYRAH